MAEARRRAEMSAGGDRTGLARARSELAVLLEVCKRDPAAALTEYRAAHAIAPSMLFPIVSARRLTPLRPIAASLALLDAELRVTTEPRYRSLQLLELARLLGVSGSAPERCCQAFRDLLALEPSHAGALRGLEIALYAMPRATETPNSLEAITSHLQTMAEAWREERRLAAWLHIERGAWLEKLGRAEPARGAFDKALELDPGIGPVRDAVTRHYLLRGRIEPLILAWTTEAGLETDKERAGRMLYAAARLCSERLGRVPQAIELHERAVAELKPGSPTAISALRELARLHEARDKPEAVVATESRLLAVVRDNEKTFYHRRLAVGSAKLGRWTDVVEHAKAILRVDPEDTKSRDQLDLALSALGQHEQRVSLYTAEASRVSTPVARTEVLLRSARIAEIDLRRPDLALVTLRAAWTIDPSNVDVCDGIQRLLTPGAPPSTTDPDDPSRVRARIDFYTEASAAAPEVARKIAFLEKLALIWEDEVRDAEQALKIYTAILALEPGRRSAIIGLQRCATRARSPRDLFRALVLEADQAGDQSLERSLLLRAAEIASEQLSDADTALDLVGRLLERNAGDPAALRAAFRIHERSGRYEEAVAQLRLLLTHTRRGQGRYAIQVEIAHLLEERLRRPEEALAAWREAARIDPASPLPRFEIRRILEAGGSFATIAEDLASLAASATTPEERGELLLEAAEIHDDRLDDPDRAITLLTQARAWLPDHEGLTERLERAYARAGKWAELLSLLETTAATKSPRAKFALASLLADDRDLPRATSHFSELVGDPSYGVAAQRTMERVLRRTERWPELDALLRKQAATLKTHEAKLGALSELAALEEYGGTSVPEAQRPGIALVHDLAPDDFTYYESILRTNGLRPGVDVSVSALATALEIISSCAPDAHFSAGLQLAAALIVEEAAEDDVARIDALRRYRAALDGWPECLTAARGAYRLAKQLGAGEALVSAAVALGNLEMEGPVRAQRLVEAALTVDSSLAGGRRVDLFCRALGEDPNSKDAAEAIMALVEHGIDPGRAAEALRNALDRTNIPEHAARLGHALAHVAGRYLRDPTVGLEALRRARKKAPGNISTLLAVAEASLGLGLYAEAAEAAASATGTTRDKSERLRASVLLVQAHAQMPGSREAAKTEASEAEKLADEASDPERAAALTRISAVHRLLGDFQRAEGALVRAVVFAEKDSTPLSRLMELHAACASDGPPACAAALEKVLSLAGSLQRPIRPEWLCALGRLEFTVLGEPDKGISRLREAARLDPSRIQTLDVIAEVCGLVGAHDRAIAEITDILAKTGLGSPSSEQFGLLFSMLSREYDLARKPVRSGVTEELDLRLGRGAGSPEDLNRQSSRRLMPNAPVALCMAPSTVIRNFLPTEPYPALLEVAASLSEIIPKLLRVDPSLGLSSRDRIQSRGPHPLRVLSDRVARAFGDLRFDLFIDIPGIGQPRLLPGDPANLLLPRGYSERTESEQIAGLARLLTYLALGIPWLEELAPEDVEGLLVGALRTGDGSWGPRSLGEALEARAELWRTRVAKTVGRRVKRTLEDLAARTSQPESLGTWRTAMRMAGFRVAYVLTGSIGATVTVVQSNEQELARLGPDALAPKMLEHPLLRDIVLFALSDESVAMRRSAGTA